MDTWDENYVIICSCFYVKNCIFVNIANIFLLVTAPPPLEIPGPSGITTAPEHLGTQGALEGMVMPYDHHHVVQQMWLAVNI